MRFILFLFALLMIGCAREKKTGSTQFTSKQQQIITEFRRMPQVAKLSVDSMKVFADKLGALAQGQPNDFKAMALLAKGGMYMNKGQYELGHKTFENALRLLARSKADTLRARALLGIGNYYKNTGDNPKALENLLAAQKIFEIRQNKSGIATSNGNLGQVYMQKNDMALAKEHLRKAMDVYAHQKWQNPYLTAAHTLANVHGISGEFGQALKIDNEAIRIADSIASPKLKVPFLDNKAMCYMYSGRLDSAEFYFNETLKIDLMVGDEKQVADSYSNLSQLELMKGNYAASEKYALKSVDILKSVHNNNNLVKSYAVLAELYTAWGKYPQAIKAKDDYVELYKKLMNEKREEAMAEFKIVHETEKKEKIIAQNHIELLKKEKEVQNRNNLIIGISLAALFIAFAGFLIYRQQRVVNRQQAQEHELKTAIAQIETQNKLQEQRLDISRDLHDNIGAQLTFIISSVDNLRYAFDLKDSKLEKKLEGINNFTKSTIIELRDTIWAMNNAEISPEDLRVRIFNFVEKAKNAKEDIDFVFNIDERLDHLRFSSVAGMNLYRTIQEAVNNAVKYAQASKIGIFIECEKDDLHLRIEDNGDGFEPESAQNGNGLHNMKKRVGALGGKFNLQSQIGQGTHIHIVIPGICAT
ncbi:sensor histidine kinase [Flavobacterium sp. MAH-1]|uniref:Oxygen sensor histidine kinase NreB n=1 Tax=Flavobacterium agri TaxID=2743471 RepID=A0A7Y8Y3C9_9FLAO|nr:sensor histidine kinase [Flavobacterium agri]NUY81825.1 sensor histidine kinase [Flavobacterium agri]NYA71849.1 sensor histidine kinase [Flavobacterium agri]